MIAAITVTSSVQEATASLRSAGADSEISALLMIRDEAQAQLLALKSSMLPQLRQQIAALEGIEAKVGRRKGSRNKPKGEAVAG